MPPIILIPLALIILSTLVVVHEFGHFLAAKLIGVWPEEFGIGLPPRAWGKKIGETLWSVNWLPLGGFVRLHGESGDAKVTKPERAFVNKSKGARAFVALAGIIMNFFFAWLCFTLMFVLTGVPKGVTVEQVEPGSPAAEAGVMPGDSIWKVNGQDVVGTEEFLLAIRNNKGKTISFDLNSSESTTTSRVNVNVREKAIEGQGLTGIVYSIKPVTVERPNILTAPFVYLFYGGRETVKWSVFTVQAIGTLFSQLGAGQVPQGLSGPFGVTLTIAEVIKYGVVAVLSFTGIISINLALINVIPFPPLDGSRVALLAVEAVAGKKKVQKVEGIILNAGMAILLILIIAITASEIPKLIKAGSIENFVNSMFTE